MLFLAQFIFWILFLVWLICSAFLILVILNQEPKGGGVGGVFAQGSALGDQLGLSGMQTQLRTLTRNSAVVFFLLSALLAYSGQKIFHVVPVATISAPAEVSDSTTSGIVPLSEEDIAAGIDAGEEATDMGEDIVEPAPAEEAPAEEASEEPKGDS